MDVSRFDFYLDFLGFLQADETVTFYPITIFICDFVDCYAI